MKNTIRALLACSILVATSLSAHELNWRNLMLASVKLQPQFDYEGSVDSYMKNFRKNVWDKYQNDEFELEDKRIETLDIMRKDVADFSLDEEFVVNINFEFGEYDFKAEEFPLNSIGPTTYFSEKNPIGDMRLGYTYKVFFKNPELIGNLEIDKESAKALLQSKKTSLGHVHRDVNAELKFKIDSIKDDPQELLAILTKVTIYADDDRNDKLQTFE